MKNIDDLNPLNFEWTESDMFVFKDTKQTCTASELAEIYNTTEEYLRDYLTPGWTTNPIYLHSKERKELKAEREIKELADREANFKKVLRTQANKQIRRRQAQFKAEKQRILGTVKNLQAEIKRLKLVNMAFQGEIEIIDDTIDYYLEYYKEDITKLRLQGILITEICEYYGVDQNRINSFLKKHKIKKPLKSK